MHRSTTTFLAAIAVLSLTALFFVLIPGMGLSARSREIDMVASGNALIAPVDSADEDDFLLSNAVIQLSASDNNDGPGEPRDRLLIDALIQAGTRELRLRVRQPMASDPLGRYQTSGGVRTDAADASLADGASWFPEGISGVAVFGYGELSCHGETLGLGLPVRVFTVDNGLPGQARLILDIGDMNLGLIGDASLPGNGRLRVMWPSYQTDTQAVPLAEDVAVCP
ncbi:MAG: hypothetical protein ACYC6B_08680 [Thermoleophilia bacterium]